MDGLWRQYAKWNRLDRARQVLYDFSYKWNFLKSWTHRNRVWNSGYQRLGSGENGEMLVKVYKFPVITWASSGYMMYIRMTIINNTVLYTWKLLGLKCAHYIQIKLICVVKENVN